MSEHSPSGFQELMVALIKAGTAKKPPELHAWPLFVLPAYCFIVES